MTQPDDNYEGYPATPWYQSYSCPQSGYQQPGYPPAAYRQPANPPAVYQQPGYPPAAYQQPGYPPAAYPGYQWPPPRPTNGMAVASMVLGILWLYWLGSILALIFGYVARNQIDQRGENGRGMATAGIVLGWVGIGLLLAALAIPALIGLSVGFGMFG